MLRGRQSVLKIHFFIESGRKMIQFKIQFKTKSKIFIQKNIHSTESIVFNGIIHSKKIEENYSKFQFNQLIFGVSLFNKQLFKWYKISWIKLILIVAAI